MATRRLLSRPFRHLRLVRRLSGESAVKQGGGGGIGGIIVAGLFGAAAGGFGALKYLENQQKPPKTAAGATDSEAEKTAAIKEMSHNSGKGNEEISKSSAQEAEGKGAARTPEGIRLALYEQFKEHVLKEEGKEAGQFNAKAEVGEDSLATSVHGTSIPPKSLEEATELIVLLEALNRGLLAKMSEDQSAFEYKEKVFKQLAPFFVSESERMISVLRKEMKAEYEKDLSALENECYKRILLQLEQQKHALFTEYQGRVHKAEKAFETMLDSTSKELKNAYDSKIDDLASAHSKRRQVRMEHLNGFKERAGALEAMLGHAIEAQKRSKQVWELSLCLLDVQDAIKSHEPFLPQWERLLDASKGDSLLESAITSVPVEIIAGGVATKETLSDRFFGKVESAAREAALIDKARPSLSGDSQPTIWGFLFAKTASFLLLPQRSYVEGDDPEDIISRAGFFMTAGDLQNCAQELESLSGEPRGIAADWLNSAKERLLVDQVVQFVKTRMAHLDVTPIKYSQQEKKEKKTDSN